MWEGIFNLLLGLALGFVMCAGSYAKGRSDEKNLQNKNRHPDHTCDTCKHGELMPTCYECSECIRAVVDNWELKR